MRLTSICRGFPEINVLIPVYILRATPGIKHIDKGSPLLPSFALKLDYPHALPLKLKKSFSVFFTLSEKILLEK